MSVALKGRRAHGAICFVLACLFAPVAVECAAAERFEYASAAMGVRARMVVCVESESSAAAACSAAFDRIADLEQCLSDYRPDSELSRLSASAGGLPVKVSPDLLDVLVKAQRVAALSDGAFDVTVGPLVRLWRSTRRTGALPGDRELPEARGRVGWRRMQIDRTVGTVRLDTSGMMLDVGGIAKGYACDAALQVLRDHGIRSAMVEMGGDIRVGDAPPGTSGWSIATASGSGDTRHLLLANAAISTSGDTEQYVEIDGVRYSHVVDPRTGLGLTNRIAVTVTAPNAATSDALATAISVLGREQGERLLKLFPGAVAYIRTAAGQSCE